MPWVADTPPLATRCISVSVIHTAWKRDVTNFSRNNCRGVKCAIKHCLRTGFETECERARQSNVPTIRVRLPFFFFFFHRRTQHNKKPQHRHRYQCIVCRMKGLVGSIHANLARASTSKTRLTHSHSHTTLACNSTYLRQN
jgi:hypothetical protein